MRDRYKSIRRARRICMIVTMVALFDGLYNHMKPQNVTVVVIAGSTTIAMSIYEIRKLSKQLEK